MHTPEDKIKFQITEPAQDHTHIEMFKNEFCVHRLHSVSIQNGWIIVPDIW